jgi:5'-3' exonuclease
MIERGATHIGVATDHVVESSFRNDLYPGYKTSKGVPQELLSRFPILEEALEAIGVMVLPMVHYEADDALASAAGKASQDDSVKQVIICTPDKDLSQYAGARRTGAAIYYLLEPGTFSEMHRLKGDEVLHFYAGDAGEMLQLKEGGRGRWW